MPWFIIWKLSFSLSFTIGPIFPHLKSRSVQVFLFVYSPITIIAFASEFYKRFIILSLLPPPSLSLLPPPLSQSLLPYIFRLQLVFSLSLYLCSPLSSLFVTFVLFISLTTHFPPSALLSIHPFLLEFSLYASILNILILFSSNFLI